MQKRETWTLNFSKGVTGWQLASARKKGGRLVYGASIPGPVVDFATAMRSKTNPNLIRVKDREAIKVIEEACGGNQFCSITDEVWLDAPEKKPTVPRGVKAIRSLKDLVEHFDAENAQDLNRRIYKDTDCGAHISVRTPDGKWHHNGDNWSKIKEINAFTIGTIIEGSDAEITSAPFFLPVPVASVDHWISNMEHEADDLWK
jgi:hypothetical protein